MAWRWTDDKSLSEPMMARFTKAYFVLDEITGRAANPSLRGNIQNNPEYLGFNIRGVKSRTPWASCQIRKIAGCAGNAGIPGACATRNFTHLVRDPWSTWFNPWPNLPSDKIRLPDVTRPLPENFSLIIIIRILSSVRFLRRPVGPRPATLLSGLQLQKRVGPVGRQLLYLICWAEWSTNVNGYWRNKILFKRYTFIHDPNQHYPEMCTLITRGIEIVSASSIKEIKVLP